MGNCECPKCRSIIGAHTIVAAITYPAIVFAAMLWTVVVYKAFGYIYAIVLFPVPIGALGYIVARYSKLQIKRRRGGRLI